MLQKSSLLHLRIPFSYFLMPVFIFAMAVIPVSMQEAPVILAIFIILHLFLYPASNGYNSYFDKDKKSIGGLEFPPPVSKELYNISLLFDAIAIAAGLLINLPFGIMLFIYGLVSKAYSHPAIRLKKFPWISWLAAVLFQGAFTFYMVVVGVHGFSALMNWKILWAGLLTSFMLAASYPMTQVYQHEEDAERGDITLSLVLGIKGTFLFAAGVFILSDLAFLYFFSTVYTIDSAILFQLFLLPVLVYFIYWFIRVLKNDNAADFKSTMRLNMLSASALNLFFLLLFMLNQKLLPWV